MKKALKWTGIVLLVLVVLPLVVMVAINAFDDKLDPQVASYGEPRAPTVADSENGYYAMLALGADDGADAQAYAKAWVAEERAAAKENRMSRVVTSKRAKRPVLCDVGSVSCLVAVRGKGDEVKAQLEAYTEDLQRYEQLIAFRRYEEVADYPMRIVTRIPSYTPMLDAQKAFLLRAALAVEAGNLEEAVNLVERDLAFQRLFLENARTLIGKLIAASTYRRDLAFVADMLVHQGTQAAPYLARLREALKPLNPAALRLAPALEWELGSSKHELLRLASLSGMSGEKEALWEKIVVRMFYQPNATVNSAYRLHQAAVVAVEQPADVLAREGKTPRPELEDMGWWDYVKNPVGNILIRIAQPDFVQYVRRLHDLDGYSRLVALQLEIAGVDAGGAAELVAKSESRFHDPYTKKPMRWDGDKKQIYFQGQYNYGTRALYGLEKGRMYVTL